MHIAAATNTLRKDQEQTEAITYSIVEESVIALMHAIFLPYSLGCQNLVSRSTHHRPINGALALTPSQRTISHMDHMRPLDVQCH